MFTRKIAEYVVQDCPDVVACYKFFNSRLELNYSFDRFIDEFYILKEHFPNIYNDFCRLQVEKEDSKK